MHKAVVSGLSPNTAYSFRVGKAGLWSPIGTFTTAKTAKEPFSFIYVTDSHVADLTQPQANSQAADSKNPNAKFWIHCGDVTLEEGEPINTMLERWKNFFTSQSNLFMKKPLAPAIGNHDKVHNNLFESHFNVQNETFDATGSTYSFIYGDAQFFAINGGRYNESTYISNLKTWMRNEVALHPDITWRIIYCHQPVYSPGYNAHSISTALLCDELNIDLILQGHTHAYSVMGPIQNTNVVQGSVKYVTSTPITNTNGKSGGLFNVQEGTLYFDNGAFGFKWFPQSISEISQSLITGCWATKLKMSNGADGFTYSNVSVSTDNITITTYKTNNGVSEFFDEIKLIKECIPSFTTPGTIIGTQTWGASQDKSGNVTIPNGATLTVTANMTASNCSIITIQGGGKLIVNGGILDGFTIVAQSGSTCTVQNNGKILLKEFDDFDIQLGATFDLIEGEVSPK